LKRFGRENGLQGKLWAFSPQHKELSARLAEALQLPLPLAQVLINRGVKTAAAGKEFLEPHPGQLHSPFVMRDMDVAVKIILQAIHASRKIAVYGDYDVDGVGATALLYDLLQRLGAAVTAYLPNRLGEGYGLHESALACLTKEGVSLVVTVDCGISNAAEVAFAREHGLEVVITDHHLPPLKLPDAAAVVNPHREDCPYPFKDLCGAGVAFKLGQALLSHAGGQVNGSGAEADPWLGMADYLDLVTLATVADMVPLLGENRVLVAYGLCRMNANLRPGLAALCELAAAGKGLTSETIAFLLAPRLNAAGRLGDASRALHLLLAEKPEDARLLAAELHGENSRRQTLETKILAEAVKMAGEMPDEEKDVLLLAAPGWPQGVIGIVASRLLELYNCPVILISLEKGQGKGSGRSGEEFDLNAALHECANLLLAFGGHHSAVGLTVPEENIPLLRRELNSMARRKRAEAEPVPAFYVDAPLQARQITAELVRGMERLEPYGFANPRPLFFGHKWLLERKKEVGRGQRHIQLGLSRDGCNFPAICFNGKTKLPDLQPLRELDILFALAFDSWRGDDALQLEIYGAAYGDEYIRGKLTMVDQRGLTQKDLYLSALCRQGDDCLVFINTLGRVGHLRRRFGGKMGLVFSHQGQLPADDPFLHTAHLILYDLPLDGQKLRKLLQNLTRKNDLKVHLLYGAADWQNNLRLLTATIPSFSVLEQIFDALREMAVPKESICLDETLAQLQKRLSFSPTKSLLEKCLQIMEQAACLGPDKVIIRLQQACGDDYCLMLKKIAATEQYNRARQQWQESLRWQKVMLEAEAGEIITLLGEGAR